MFTPLYDRTTKKVDVLSLMLVACHKKSYLICDEFMNFRNIYVISILIFFSMYKTETVNRAETAAGK